MVQPKLIEEAGLSDGDVWWLLMLSIFGLCSALTQRPLEETKGYWNGGIPLYRFSIRKCFFFSYALNFSGSFHAFTSCAEHCRSQRHQWCDSPDLCLALETGRSASVLLSVTLMFLLTILVIWNKRLGLLVVSSHERVKTKSKHGLESFKRLALDVIHQYWLSD